MKSGEQVALVKEDGSIVKGKISKLFTFHGLKKVEATHAEAGEIVAIAGFTTANVGDTIANLENPTALVRIK